MRDQPPKKKRLLSAVVKVWQQLLSSFHLWSPLAPSSTPIHRVESSIVRFHTCCCVLMGRYRVLGFGSGVQPGGADVDGEEVQAAVEREEPLRRGAGDRWGAERGDGSRGRGGERQDLQVRTPVYATGLGSNFHVARNGFRLWYGGWLCRVSVHVGSMGKGTYA